MKTPLLSDGGGAGSVWWKLDLKALNLVWVPVYWLEGWGATRKWIARVLWILLVGASALCVALNHYGFLLLLGPLSFREEALHKASDTNRLVLWHPLRVGRIVLDPLLAVPWHRGFNIYDAAWCGYIAAGFALIFVLSLPDFPPPSRRKRLSLAKLRSLIPDFKPEMLPEGAR
jgi:hypothetical protein